jgi:hypothetical protein
MGFRDTGRVDEANEEPFSIAYLPSGWSIIWSNSFEYASRPDVIRRSSAAKMLGCHVEEHVMFSSCHAAQAGEMVWNVWHDAQKGIYDIHSTGSVPKEFDGIAATQKEQQDAHGGSKSEVDYLIDAPIDLAAAITGYRYDRWRYTWGEPHFTIIEKLG